MTNDISSQDAREAIREISETIAENRGWFIFLGVGLLILGIVAIAFPFLSTIVAKTFLGWLFLFAGVFQLVHSFSTKDWSEFFFALVVALLYTVVGAWLVFFPLAGIITLTILVALTFLLQGVVETTMAFRLRPISGWGWMLVAGVLSLVLGGAIIAWLPETATWVIGVLVGINFISSGVAYLFLASVAREMS